MSETNRTPPSAEAAERGMLGCLLLDPLRASSVVRGEFCIGEDAFYFPAHRILAGTIFRMLDAHEAVDLITVAQKLRDSGQLEAVGGDSWLMNVVDQTPTVEHVSGYAHVARQKAIARGIIEAAREIAEKAYTTDAPDALLAKAPDRFLGIIGTMAQEQDDGELIDGIVKEWVEARKHNKPAIDLYTPWDELTMLMQGLEVGVTIVAGRPSAGKTTLEGILSAFQCEKGLPVARATADSTRKQLMQRALCNKSGVSMAKLKFGFARNSQIEQVEEAGRTIRGWPQFVNAHDTEITAICSWARAMKMRHGIRLLTVDYIQQLRASHLGGYAANDPVTRVTTISSMLKALSFELGIPVVVLSQLSREVEKENRTPRLSDLRDSGGIEQDASKVLFCYVDAKKRKAMDGRVQDATKHKRPVWLELLKNKDGGTGGLPFWLFPPYFKFEPATAAMVGGEWDNFSDDSLPCEKEEEEKKWEAAPELIPRDEAGGDGMKSLAQIRKGAGTEEQEEEDPRYT